MYKKILIPIFITFLLVLSVNALSPNDADCLNNNECESGVCQGGKCRAADIGDLLDLISSTSGAQCGDDVVDSGEDCDGANLDNEDCESLGYLGGTLACSSDCQSFDTTDCDRCDFNADCGDEYCRTSTGKCVECLQDSHCGSDDEECNAYVCEFVDTGGDSAGEDGTGAPNSGYNQFGCYEQWECSEWSSCMLGKKTRTCEDIYDCGTEEFKPGVSFLCTAAPAPTCFDGTQNQNEQGVDCGGPCAKICASCYDQEQNCHQGLCEEDVDCGGPCMPCALEKASHKVSFWIIFITVILILIILVLGFWYWKLRGSAEDIGKQVDKMPTQPSSMLRI